MIEALADAMYLHGIPEHTGNGSCNDYAFVRRPGRPPLLLSAYYAAPGMTLAKQEAVLRQVGAIIVAWQA